MRTIISLFLTFLCVGWAAPLIFALTAAGSMALNDYGYTTIASFLPLIVLVVSIILIKIIYNVINYLIRSIFG